MSYSMKGDTSEDSEDACEDEPEKKKMKGKFKQKKTKSIRQSNQGISDDDYRELLHDISEWYDGSDSISMLKVLYRDHVTDVHTLDKANKMRDLLENLHTSGNLSPTDLNILYDTINITKQFGFQPKNEDLLPLFQNVRKFEISKFTPHRQKLVNLGMTLNEADVATLDGWFNTQQKKYADSWHLIKDLEHRRVICEENMKAFIETLKKLQHFLAVEALIEGYGGSANDVGESTMSGHRQQQPPPARQSFLPQQLQQPQEQTLTYQYLIRNQSTTNSLGLDVQGTPSISSNSTGLSDEDKIIREYLLSRQKRVCSTNRLFTPATLNTAYHVDIADMFTDLDLLKEGKNQVKDDAKPTTLKEVLDIIKSTPACKVLIEGEGGIGKSTLLRYLAFKWSTGQSDVIFKGKIVFLVQIRDIDEDKTILDAILKQINLEDFHLETELPKNPILIKRFIRKHNDIILLLDGLDELKGGCESPICIFKNEIMYKCKVILTSRSENLNEFIKYCSIHVKVNGFNRNNVKKYIKKHFAFFKKTELGDLLIKELLGPMFNTHMEVYSMCKNPMLLLLVCVMWEEKKHLPADKAELFKDIFRCFLNQFIDKKAEKEQKISIFENTPEKYVEAMLLLGKCFYESLKKNQLSVNKRDLKGPNEMVALALKLGFVYEDTPNLKSDFDEIFTTPHKLIVESLVGFYLYKLCQTEMENECSKDMEILLKPLADNEWQMIRRSEYFHMARVFTIGFLGAKSARFLSHWISNDVSTYHSLMTYLEFVKKEHMDTVENAVIDHMTMTDLEIKPHIYGICKSVRTFISYIIPNVGLNQNKHFIQLMRIIGYIYKHQCLNEKVLTDINRFFRGMSSGVKGRMLAHVMIAAVSNDTQSYLFKEIVCRICIADDVSYLTAEFRKLNFKYNITNYNLSEQTTVSCAVHLFTNAPQLTALHSYGSFAMNDVIRECSSRKVKLELRQLDISKNDLSNINGSSFASLFLTTKLNFLYLNDCRLSGDIISDMIRECSSRGVKLELSQLDISKNNLSNIDGSLFASLFISPELNMLDLIGCTLSGDIINDMIRECSSRGVKLELETLNISNNYLCNIDGSSLASLFITPTLNMLGLSNCTLSGDIINDMIRECSSRGVKLELEKLNISNNNLSNIDGSSFASLFIITPKLIMLNLANCTLSGDIINDMIRECSSRGVKLELRDLDISNNNLSNIDGSSFSSLFITPKLKHLYMSNCSLSGDTMNIIREWCSSRKVNFEL
ncbi:NACHT, LRR and PYD domains-containing protein 3-like [Anneissia japonica]|uniref:NACHT, LRR and PYD domains-containing protein 3-like n=1 Tax=Anneissia japonica TaxID=1529436 RepID=UPI0014258F8C|nr:NACHT, LRR and PYD domains-containing protein 3-like [Anneissia japonica]